MNATGSTSSALSTCTRWACTGNYAEVSIRNPDAPMGQTYVSPQLQLLWPQLAALTGTATFCVEEVSKMSKLRGPALKLTVNIVKGSAVRRCKACEVCWVV